MQAPLHPGTLPRNRSESPIQTPSDNPETAAESTKPRRAAKRRPAVKAKSAPLPLPDPGPPPGGFAPLTTERLTLRPFVPEDAAAVHSLINDWAVTRTLAAVPFPYGRDLADEWIPSARRQLEAGTAYHLAVTGREGEQEVLVGSVGLRVEAKTRTGQLGYGLGGASGGMAWRPKRLAGSRGGRSPISISTV